MRGTAALLVLTVLVSACGEGRRVARATPEATVAAPASAPETSLRVGLVGGLNVHVPGAVPDRGTLSEVAADSFVVVPSGADAAGLVDVAAAHPMTHFALVGGSGRVLRLPNVAGLVIRGDQAALLAGAIAGLVARDEDATRSRVAWAGPRDRVLGRAFAHGVHEAAPTAQVEFSWSSGDPAACKEAALGAIGRGAVAVLATRGQCAEAALAGAHQQNVVGLQLADFELRDVVAAAAVRDAVAGSYHSGEDVVYGVRSGAIGIVHLDPRISAVTALRARTAVQQLASGLRLSG